MKMLKILYGCAVVVSSVVLGNMAWANQPTNAQIIQWISNLDESSADPKRDIKIENTQEVTLYSGEKAYISGVYFNQSARNFWGGYILTRPQLKQSRIIQFGGQANTFRVHPIYLPAKERGLDLIEFESGGSGQGAIEASKSMTYIHNWTVKTLHEVTEGSYEGRYSDVLDDIDCKTGSDDYAYLNVIDYGRYILETTVESNGCEAKKPQDYKINSKLVPINIP